jgi:hypothetical protein
MNPDTLKTNINTPSTLETPAQEIASVKDAIVASANLPDMTKEGLNRVIDQITTRLSTIQDSREALIAEMRAISSNSGLYHNVGNNPEKIKAHSKIIEATKTAIEKKLNTPAIATETNINQFTDVSQSPLFPLIQEVILTGPSENYQIGLDSNGKLIGFDKETSSPMSIVFKENQMILTPNGDGIEDTSALKRFTVYDVFTKLSKRSKIDISKLNGLKSEEPAPQPTPKLISPEAPKVSTTPVIAPTPQPLPMPITPVLPPIPKPQANPTQTVLPPRPPNTIPKTKDVTTPASIDTSSTAIPPQKPIEPSTQKPQPTEAMKSKEKKTFPSKLEQEIKTEYKWKKLFDVKVFENGDILLVGENKYRVKESRVISCLDQDLRDDYKLISQKLLNQRTNTNADETDRLSYNQDRLFSIPEVSELPKNEEVPKLELFDDYLEYSRVYLANPNSILNQPGLKYELNAIGNELYYQFYSPEPSVSISEQEKTTKSETYQSVIEESVNDNGIDPNVRRTKGGWNFSTFGNFKDVKTEDLGRIYFNVEPLQAPLLYNMVVKRLIEQNITSQFKISSKYEDRPDGGVLYFSHTDQVKVQAIIKEIVDSKSFTLRDELGKGQHQISTGIGFAQEPNIPVIKGVAFKYNEEVNVSFGEKLTWVMGVVLKKIKDDNLDLTKDKNKILQMYTAMMEQHGIDPKNPAFYSKDSKFESFRTFKI